MAGAFRVECKKARRRHDGLLCLLVPCIIILWVGGLSAESPEELANGYSGMLYSVPVIHCIVLPVLMAVLASRLWDMEKKGNMRKLLYTMQSRRSLFGGKILFGSLEIGLVTLLEIGGLLLTGRLHGYTEALPGWQFIYLAVCTLAVDLMLFFFSFLVVLLARNSLPALCVGIVGALVGLFSAFMPQIVSYFVPWGYFIPLGAYEVAHWEQETRTVTYGARPWNLGLLLFTMVMGTALLLACWRKVQRQEV